MLGFGILLADAAGHQCMAVASDSDVLFDFDLSKVKYANKKILHIVFEIAIKPNWLLVLALVLIIIIIVISINIILVVIVIITIIIIIIIIVIVVIIVNILSLGVQRIIACRDLS